MKYLILICFSAAFLSAQSQPACTAAKSFDSLHLFLKENYAGYSDKVNASNKKEFALFTEKHIRAIQKTKKKAYSYQVIKDWLKFFKDEHLSMSVQFDTANGKLARDIAAVEQFPMEGISTPFLEKTTSASIEGIYYTSDSSYKVAVVKNDNGFRKYAGIILSAKAPEWKPGNVKFELVPGKGSNEYDVIWYNRYHYPIFGELDFSKGNSFHTQGWYKSNYEKPGLSNSYTPLFEEEKLHNAFFRQLDDQTSYIRISSFDANFIQSIDSVIKTNTALLESLPYMIIDVRGNGGGADISYRPLKRFMYTDPVKNIGVDLLATPYNIDITLQLINSISGMPEADKKEYSDLMENARKSNKRMFNFFPDTTITSEAIPFPKKIAVIINGRCGSTTEQFLLEARQSKKVRLFGTHSMGVLDYANVREKEICNDFTVNYPTTRSRRIDIGEGIDNVGIRPDVVLDFNNPDWLITVQKEIKK
ncbi:S41 family peptidase [Terrimonas sp. NA20]|uniref:S41 family peptidase n=1 Tax=Terrimonas ginsenosidimutans TaxID=2908004 RepID=A0ABS9L026_9BACT|nr:S41 family peptidase [Terrimonas ginsenosidimutans]MCG2617961.1 S41 family peptidase [Terrimonas ginsenosidimutans]